MTVFMLTKSSDRPVDSHRAGHRESCFAVEPIAKIFFELYGGRWAPHIPLSLLSTPSTGVVKDNIPEPKTT